MRMSFYGKNIFSRLIFAVLLGVILVNCTDSSSLVSVSVKPRVLISSDIGGTDPDDFQSMIHLLMYANEVQIEGIVSSPFGKGRTDDIESIIKQYETDLPRLNKHRSGFPHPDSLRKRCKQGAIAEAPFLGYRTSTEGSDWIVNCAQKKSDQPLWVLVWGGLEDVAQALHDAPEIKENIRVYWIGGPNKKWSVNAYYYIAAQHPDLWMIEANATYRGWFMDEGAPDKLKGDKYYAHYIKGRGAMGADFINYYEGKIKMGDTPSLAYVMNGNPDDPQSESWGGQFTPVARSPKHIFKGRSSLTDTVPAYSVLEWHFEGPALAINPDSTCFTLHIQNQDWPGFYLGDGLYAVRYSPKRAEVGEYKTTSVIPELDGLAGQYVSIVPFPGKASPDDFKLGSNWYTDMPDDALFIDNQQGARTVARHRQAFLTDWAERWTWLQQD